jgi:hypothetical protein
MPIINDNTINHYYEKIKFAEQLNQFLINAQRKKQLVINLDKKTNFIGITITKYHDYYIGKEKIFKGHDDDD